MREIKFRGWDGEVKRMWSWRELCNTHFCASLYSHGDGSWEVMQYTGLHDKNGKEIYEGDIVSTFEPDEGSLFEEVVFENGTFKLRCMSDNTKINYPLGSLRSKYIEVIGNIYENPELIQS